MKKRSIYILSVALLLLLIGLSACGEDGKTTRVVFTTDFGKDEVFRIGGLACTKPEFMLFLTTTQNQYEGVYGEPIWQTEFHGVSLEDNVKETELEKVAQIKSMYLLAKEKELTLSETEEQKIVQAAEEFYLLLNDTEKTMLGVSEEMVAQLYREYAMANKVYRFIIQDINPEISDDEARTIKVQHIFMRKNFAQSSDERQKEILSKKMEAVRVLACDGEHDFAELAAEYSEDTILTYSFGKGEMDSAFEEASFLLETDEISPVIESESGFHIIKCINTFDREQTDANKLQIVEKRRNEAFGKEYDQFVETLARQLNQKLWDEIAFLHDENLKTTSFFDVFLKYFPE